MILRFSSPLLPSLLLQIVAVLFVSLSSSSFVELAAFEVERPNIILVMADDQGWGETGYYSHPVLKTPSLDVMSENALRLDRFYAGCPVCSPTRASVLTGRSHNRAGVQSHGYALRLQEKTLAQALQSAGYATGHFGKWHLNGMRGPGVPIFGTDSHHPGVFGFDTWISVTNFFDRNPILSRNGEFEEFQGDSSEIVVEQALGFISEKAAAKQPSFTVIWFGTPHSPFMAADEDRRAFTDLDENSANHYGELVAMDRAMGTLRNRLRELDIANDTLLWFCSDNGGLPKIKPTTVGNLRGFKGSLYEGGLRVPCLIEWPNKIAPRVSKFPAMVVDIQATIFELLDLPESAMIQPQDGRSLLDLFEKEQPLRRKPIAFNYSGQSALIDNDWKLLMLQRKKKPGKAKQASGLRGGQVNGPVFELYNLLEDAAESNNLLDSKPEVARRMKDKLNEFLVSLEASVEGSDYPEERVTEGNPEPRFWTEVEDYMPYFDAWRNRPEYRSRLNKL